MRRGALVESVDFEEEEVEPSPLESLEQMEEKRIQEEELPLGVGRCLMT